MTPVRVTRPLLPLAILAGSVLVACGGDGTATTRTDAPSEQSTAEAGGTAATGLDPAATIAGTAVLDSLATPSTSATTAAPTTDPPTTEPPTTVPPTTVPSVPWSDTADGALASITAAVTSGSGTPDVLATLFASPVDVPLPADAALSIAHVEATATDAGWDVSWTLDAASTAPPADLEAAVSAGFADARFEAGIRVESTLDSGVFVTLNYPATAAGAADGWSSLAITIGPETDMGTPTGRNEVEISALRSVTGDVAAVRDLLGPFLTSWVAEMPAVPADAVPTQLRGELVQLSGPPSVWLDATWSTDPATFADLVTYYAQDLSAGPLVLEASTPPEDLTTVDRFVAGFFPTLAGHDIWVTVERDLTAPDAPAEIAYEVRLDPPA